MEPLAGILTLVVAAIPLGALAAWLATRGRLGLGNFVAGGSGTWWRVAMPWPRGVQEEEPVAWRIEPSRPAWDEPTRDSTDLPSTGREGGEVDLEPVRASPHIRAR